MAAQQPIAEPISSTELINNSVSVGTNGAWTNILQVGISDVVNTDVIQVSGNVAVTNPYNAFVGVACRIVRSTDPAATQDIQEINTMPQINLNRSSLHHYGFTPHGFDYPVGNEMPSQYYWTVQVLAASSNTTGSIVVDSNLNGVTYNRMVVQKFRRV